MTFENSVDPHQARQNVGTDLDPNWLTLCNCIAERIFQKVDFEKKLSDDKKHAKLPNRQRVNP